MVMCAGDSGTPGFSTETNTISSTHPSGIFDFTNRCGEQGGDPPGDSAFLRIAEHESSGNAGQGAYGRFVLRDALVRPLQVRRRSWASPRSRRLPTAWVCSSATYAAARAGPSTLRAQSPGVAGDELRIGAIAAALIARARVGTRANLSRMSTLSSGRITTATRALSSMSSPDNP